tara:strand:- start:1554 stop:1793 length:240 start_codon:yes stop_codon:yes gene_type:complete
MPPINNGTNASKLLASQQHHPLQSVSGAVGIVYEMPKKMGVFPKPPALDASPLRGRSTQKMTWCSATGRRHHDKHRRYA